MTLPQSVPGLQLRPAGYSYRQRVPADIRSAIGKTEIVLSLKTNRLSVANKRATVLAGQVQQMFNEVRIRLGKLDHCAAQSIAENWKRRTLNEDFERRLNGQETIKLDDRSHEQVVNRLLEDRNRLSFQTIRHSVDALSEKHGIDRESDETDWRRLAYYMTRAHVDMLNEVYRRNHDSAHEIEHYLEGDARATEVECDKAPLCLSKALSLWEGESERAVRTVTEWRRSIRVFIELFGDLPVSQIKAADLRKYYKECMRLPKHVKRAEQALDARELLKKYEGRKVDRISPASAKKMFSGVRSVLEVCVAHEHLPQNPALGIRLPKVKAMGRAREPFSRDDLKAIFEDSPIYQQTTGRLRYAGEAGYWIPLIALYHGMRLEEIGQLRLTDVKQEDGVSYFNVDTLHDGQTLKTASSIRKVPIHPELDRLGFRDYLEKLQRLRQTHLFPHLNHGNDKCTRAFSKWVNRYMRETCGITDRKKVFHSFRHTFKDACRNAGIAKDVHDRLTGHAGHTVSDDYGSGHSLTVLGEAIQKVSYPIQPPRWK